MPLRDGSDLCLQCGLCCNGTLFETISILPDERTPLEVLGTPVDITAIGSIREMPLPCAALVGACCSIYGSRPSTCGRYKCGVLHDYEAGADINDCLTVIDRVRFYARALEIEIGIPAGTYSRQAGHDYIDAHDPAQSPIEHAGFLAAFHGIDALSLEHFQYNPHPMETEAAAAGATPVEL